MTEVFLDASFAIALASSSDQYHERAQALAARVETDGRLIVTTRAVVLEIGNALLKRRTRSASVALLRSISDDPKVEVVPLEEPLYERAFELYGGGPDKGWGPTDCLSFAVMQGRGIIDALTADQHFRQAGFRALLLDR